MDPAEQTPDTQAHREAGGLRRLDDAANLFESVFTVAPLVLVGTRELDGSVNLAPKLMAMPLGWSGKYCFACTPRHRTHVNAERTEMFSVSYVTPEQAVVTGQAAAERDVTGDRPELAALPTVEAAEIDGVLVEGAHAALECRLLSIIRDGDESLVIGTVVAAHARPSALRAADRDDADVVFEEPLLAYVTPGRLARVDRTTSFPFPARVQR